MTAPGDIFDTVRKVFGDKPAYLLAGAGDLAAEKLRDLPDAFGSLQSSLRTEYRDLPMRAASAVVGQAFRANVKAGELYDELSRRGEEAVAKMRGETVYAEEDEPFVREPFMPRPTHRTQSEMPADAMPADELPAKKPPAKVAKKAGSKKPASKKPASKSGGKKPASKAAKKTRSSTGRPKSEEPDSSS